MLAKELVLCFIIDERTRSLTADDSPSACPICVFIVYSAETYVRGWDRNVEEVHSEALKWSSREGCKPQDRIPKRTHSLFGPAQCNLLCSAFRSFMNSARRGSTKASRPGSEGFAHSLHGATLPVTDEVIPEEGWSDKEGTRAQDKVVL